MMRDTRNGFVALVALMVLYLAANETGQTPARGLTHCSNCVHQFQKSANAVNSLS